jgi:hypothetical protein
MGQCNGAGNPQKHRRTKRHRPIGSGAAIT